MFTSILAVPEHQGINWVGRSTRKNTEISNLCEEEPMKKNTVKIFWFQLSYINLTRPMRMHEKNQHVYKQLVHIAMPIFLYCWLFTVGRHAMSLTNMPSSA